LSNGENAHCSVYQKEWWFDKIDKLKPEGIKVFLFTEADKKEEYHLECIK